MKDTTRTLAPRRGRPRKFDGPSRAVTLTLPLDVIAALSALDGDISRAVVRLAQPVLARRPRPAAELAIFGKRAVIVVNPARALERRTGVNLVPLPDGRALISFDRAMTPAALELLVSDALEDRKLPPPDRAVFEGIRTILRNARQDVAVSLRQATIIVLERRGAPRGTGRPRRGRPVPGTLRPGIAVEDRT